MSKLDSSWLFSKLTLIQRHWKKHVISDNNGADLCRILLRRLDYIERERGGNAWLMGADFQELKNAGEPKLSVAANDSGLLFPPWKFYSPCSKRQPIFKSVL